MINLLQPTYGATLPRLPESDPSVRILERTLKNKHAGLGSVTGGATVSADALVESAMAADTTYGLLSTQLTLAASQYEQTANLMFSPITMPENVSLEEREQQQTDIMS